MQDDAAAAAVEHHSVIIIGGGLSGLYAARLLKERFPDLLLVEASSALGGRIKQVEGIAGWPMEAGPEFVHGGNALLKGLLEEMGCSLRELQWPDRWYWPGRLAAPGEKDEELEWLEEKFGGVGDVPPPERDMSAEAWLRLQGASRRALAAAEACYANDFGCGLRQLGLREMIVENRAWDAGESYLLLDRSLRELVAHLAAPLAGSVRAGWPVSRVAWAPQQRDGGSSQGPGGSGHGRCAAAGGSGRGSVTLHGPAGQRLCCGRLLVTVPLTTLQAGDICFQPPLPLRKQAAIGRLRMGNAVKILLGFTRPVWPRNFWDAVCPGALLPEIWVTSYPEGQQPPHLPVSHHGSSAAGAAHAGVSFVTAAQLTPGAAEDSPPAQPSAGLDKFSPADGGSGGGGVSGSLSNSGMAAARVSGAGTSLSSDDAAQHSAAQRPGGSRYCVTAFACGPSAMTIARLQPAEAVRRALWQLDDMFGGSSGSSGGASGPASAAFVSAAVVDWSQQPYIRGAYSYPTLGAEPGDREALAAPVGAALFFAGEATHLAVNPCMQAALETGQTAAAQIIAAASPQRSAL